MSTVVWIARVEGPQWRRQLTFVSWGDLENGSVERAIMGLSDKAPGNVPQWLISRMQRANVTLPTFERGASKVVLEGIAKLTSRGFQTHEGPLTNWDEEGRLLLEMYLTPMDACKIKVVEAERLQHPISIAFREQQDRIKHRQNRDRLLVADSRAGVKRVTVQNDIWTPILPGDADFMLENGRTVQDQIVSWGAQGERKY